jgi:hypothetical protein
LLLFLVSLKLLLRILPDKVGLPPQSFTHIAMNYAKSFYIVFQGHVNCNGGELENVFHAIPFPIRLRMIMSVPNTFLINNYLNTVSLWFCSSLSQLFISINLEELEGKLSASTQLHSHFTLSLD